MNRTWRLFRTPTPFSGTGEGLPLDLRSVIEGAAGCCQGVSVCESFAFLVPSVVNIAVLTVFFFISLLFPVNCSHLTP